MTKFLFLSFFQIFDLEFRKIIWLSLAGSLLIFFCVWVFVGYFISKVDFVSTNFIVSFFGEIANSFVRLVGGALVLVLSWFLFPSIASMILALFLEKAAFIVENKHYPKFSKYRSQSLYEIIYVSLKYTGLSLLVNVMFLPVYVSLFFLGPLNLMVFFIVNGYLLGREYFELVSHRRLSLKTSKMVYKNSKKTVFFAGCIIAVLMTLPFINLIAPLIAVALMVHITHKLHSENQAF